MTALDEADRRRLDAARSATLATIDPQGRPRLVPVCFVVEHSTDIVWSPLDEKPKAAADVRELARVRDIAARPRVTLLVDHWSEDWTELAWLRLIGTAALVDPPDVPAAIITDLRARYPQYGSHDLEHRPMLRIAIDRVVRWSAASATASRP